MPAAIALSERILKNPMLPVAPVWQPGLASAGGKNLEGLKDALDALVKAATSGK